MDTQLILADAIGELMNKGETPESILVALKAHYDAIGYDTTRQPIETMQARTRSRICQKFADSMRTA